MRPKVTIIVLNWNCAADTMNCVDSLLAQSYSNISVLIVDNASTDNSAKTLKDYVNTHSSVELTLNSHNSGFAGGINTGIKQALLQKADYIGTLNPDAVAEKTWVSALVDNFSDRKVGISVGALLRSDGKTIDSCGEGFSIWGLSFPMLRDEPASAIPTEKHYVFGATGGAVLYKSSMLRDIGMFDEKFFMYYEDADLNFRAQLAGYKARYTPLAKAYHKQGASAGKIRGLTNYHTFKNIPLLVYKNTPNNLLYRVLPRFWLSYTLSLLKSILSGRGLSALHGLLGSLILLPHALRERVYIQSSKKTDSKYLLSIIGLDIPPQQAGLRKLRSLFTGGG